MTREPQSMVGRAGPHRETRTNLLTPRPGTLRTARHTMVFMAKINSFRSRETFAAIFLTSFT